MIRASILLSTALALTVAPAFADETVPVGHFENVELSGGGHIVVRPGAVQSVTLLNGSTQFTRFRVKHDGTLEIQACNNECPGHYDLEIAITTPDITGIAVRGGGAVKMETGFKLDELDVAVMGGGSIDGREVTAQNVNAAVNGGGKIRVTANGELNAAVNGGGNITYWGKPEVRQAVAGGGSIQSAGN